MSTLARFHFDFVDPLSYLQEIELGRLDPAIGGRVERTGFELVPPPAPLSRRRTGSPSFNNRERFFGAGGAGADSV